MKFSLVTLVAALAATVVASDFEAEAENLNVFEERGNPPKCDKVAKQIPACARKPITKCTVKAGCGPRDYKCGCAKKQQIQKCATAPVLKACGQQKGLQARAAANKLCKCANS